MAASDGSTKWYIAGFVLAGVGIGALVFSSFEYRAFVAAVIIVIAVLSLMAGTTITLRREMEERQNRGGKELDKK